MHNNRTNLFFISILHHSHFFIILRSNKNHNTMSESEIQKKIRLAIGSIARMFRNNVGSGWQGRSGSIKVTSDGSKYITLASPRPLKAGLCEGSSDLIGWTSKTITPEMVGETVAVFTAIEVKTATGRASKEQINFIRAVIDSGGIAGIARDEAQAVHIIKNWGAL